MKKKYFVVGIISMALVFGFFLLGCEEKEPEIKYGSLTIKNLPSVPSGNWGGQQVQWFGAVYFDEDITSQTHFHNYTFGGSNAVADFKNPDNSFSSTSPFSLMDSNEILKGFLKSGTYLVHIQPLSNSHSQYRAIMSNVAFKEGKATIDYNDMTRYDSLPYYDN